MTTCRRWSLPIAALHTFVGPPVGPFVGPDMHAWGARPREVLPLGVMTWLEETQAPGMLTVAVTPRLFSGNELPTMMLPRLSADTVRTGGMRWGRTQRGTATWAAAKITRVMAMAGMARRGGSPVGTAGGEGRGVL